MSNKKMAKIKNDIKLSISAGKPITGKYTEKMNIGNLLIEASKSEEDKGILFIQNNEEIFLSYEQILEKAVYCLGELQENGLKQDDFAIISFQNNIDFTISFWACIIGGIIPVPITPPASYKGKSASLEKLINVWNILKKPIIISDSAMLNGMENRDSYSDCNDMVMLDISILKQSTVKGSINLSSSDKPAFIQFSSGSTSTPKGVILTHKSLLINIEAIIEGAGFTSEDKFLSWMPYYHDMGLIGCNIAPVAVAMFQINMHPINFVKKPTLWFDLISQHRVTITSSPNFGFRLLLKKVTEKQLKTWDLSSVRVIFNGAEPISMPLAKEFMETLAVCNLPETSMFLVYGMAEACLAVTFPSKGINPESHCISRNSLINDSIAKEVQENDLDSYEVANEGYPVAGMEVRIVDKHGKVVIEKQLGEIQIKGDNVTSGYINNPEATIKFFQDEWLKTGDIGFMIDKKICVTGRIKDIIFVNGQNFFAHDIEFKLEEIDGVEPGKVVVCGWHDEKEGREKIALFSSLRVNKDNFINFYSNILKKINETFGIVLEYVILTKIIPKTTSGKVQRFMLVKSFLNNEYEDDTFTSDELLYNIVEKDTEVETSKPLIKNLNKDKIREIWSEILEKPAVKIGYNQPFLSLGGTSLKAVQVLGMIEDELGVTLSHELLINCKTINDMDEYIRNLTKVNTLENNITKTNHDLMDKDDDIAVIEMSCRFPDASSPEEFWNNIVKGKCSINEIPGDRWDINQYYSPEVDPTKTNCRTGAFLDNPFEFDAEFFNISDEEAAVMDPQQRIILELAYEILERGGYSKQKISGKSLALFIGASTNAYYEYHLNTLKMLNLKNFDSITSLTNEQQESILKEWKNKFGVTSFHSNLLVDNILNMIAARTSQELNLKGPSIVVDTACSSSIVTIHMACESLRRGECELAIAGGINLLLTPTPYIYLSNAGALSTSGVSRVFDAKADGLVPGEGAGLVLLKPLKKAIADNDKVLAVIKASAINNDGHSIGVMAPNPDGQREVIESLYVDNGYDAKDIQYVEAHGTGTKIGDPSEVRALDSAFKRWSPKANSIAIGSVKANIGHLLNSAGIASFIKVVLALNNKIMPPSVNLSELNPSIKFDKTPFYTILEAKKWDVAKGVSRRASINSFGFGGTNCHMIVEEAKELVKTKFENQYERPNNVLCLSANTKKTLEQKIVNLVQYLKINNENSLGDICYEENQSRSLFKYRYSVVAESSGDLLNKLQEVKLDDTYDKARKIALMFTGQGAQYVGMARDLYENLPIFRSYIQECSNEFYPYLNEKLTDLIYSAKADKDILAQTNITQPVIFAIDYAFGKLFMDLGVRPAYMIGHSVGEWSAACLSGVVSLHDAAKIVTARGKLMDDLKSSGGMCAVFTSGYIIEQLLKDFDSAVWIAAYNGTHQVISGEINSIEKFCELLFSKEIGFKILDVSQAFHTPLMNPILDDFREVLESATFNAPKIPIVSNVTGEIMDTPFDVEYWIKHILASVKFEQSIKYLSDNSVNIFIECGPGSVLAGMAGGIQTSNSKTILLSSDRKKDAFGTCLGALGSLFSLGVNIDFEKLETGIHYDKVQLPLYPFQRKTYKPDFGIESAKVPNNWFYNWNWLPEISKPLTVLPSGNIIVFDDGNGFSKELTSILDSEENRLYVVYSGAEYSNDSNRNFTINPLLESDYAKLFKDIPGPIAAVIHLWNLKRENFNKEFVFDDMVMHEDIYSVLCIGKELAKLEASDIKLLLVTNGGIPIQNYKMLNPHQSVAVTLALAIDEENTFINSYCIDIDKKEYKSSKELAQNLYNEMMRELNTEGIVVIRDGVRYTRDLININELDKLPNNEFNDGETYLITGGVSPVGGEIAEAFAKKAKINLVLTGREKLPLRDDWDKEISNNSKFSKKINLILKLEELGGNVSYEAVDVTNIDDMEALIIRVNDIYGGIHGVIHAAGTWDSSTFKLVEKEIDAVSKVLQPKVQGTVITDLVTRKEPLKFFVMLSSVSCSQKAWSAGLGDYAAANSFMPAYGFYRESQNAPGRTLTLNYSLWSKTGMGSGLGDIALNAIKAQGLNPLAKEKAVEALMMALSNGSPNVIHIIDKIEISEGKKSSSIKVSTLDFKKLKNTRETVYGVIAKQLAIDMETLDIGQNFVDLGLDSLGAVKVMESLRHCIGIELYPTLIFEYQTPDALAEYIEKIYSAGFEEVAASKIDILEKNNLPDEKIKDIAIIGASVRIPGANTLDEYWNILETGKCVISEVPTGRWSSKNYFNTDVNSSHTSYTKHGGFIDKPYDFDPLFFGMSPSEAAVTDPQQRIFLEIAWEALQQAGYGGRYKSKSIGVFVGCEQSTYAEHFANNRTYMELKNDLSSNKMFNNISKEERNGIMNSILNVLQPAKMVPDAVAGNSLNEVAARVSHCLDLTGPSLTINSACSSSLSALHLACESIRSGNSKMAIAGGVNLNLSPTPYVGLSRISALSSTGICYPFDSKANGMVLSEGSSAVLLKPLADAIRDKDNIMAVIKGSAINNDGHSQGITAPRPMGQAEAIRKAYQDSNINPETISYVETHGTGTPLGDPIEIEGLTHAFRSFTAEKGFCAIGSVKSSIGHMLSASGITSLIKVVLALKNKTIPHTINYDKLSTNTNIDFENSPFYVASGKPMLWKGSGVNPLRAGVNAFGFGGTNVHVVLEEAPIQMEYEEEKPPYILQLTGRNKDIVKQIAINLRNYVKRNQGLSVASICFTMNNSQKELSTKTAAIVKSRKHLLEVLTCIENGENIKEIFEGRSNPNREAQSYLLLDGNIKIDKVYKQELCTRYVTFNDAYKECMDKYSSLENNNNFEAERIDSFATQYALGVLLSDFDLKIYGMIAKGTGIAAAAVLAGLINLDKAMEQIIGNNIIENATISDNNKNAVYLNCPILTPSGVIEEKLDIRISDEEDLKDLSGFVNKNSVVIYPGNIKQIENSEVYHDKLFTLVEMNINENPVESIITALAKIYTLGTRYNPNKLFKGMEKKVTLPTYPFENETYKVSFEEEVTLDNSDLGNTEQKKMLKIDTNYTLSEVERKSSSNELANDLKMFR